MISLLSRLHRSSVAHRFVFLGSVRTMLVITGIELTI